MTINNEEYIDTFEKFLDYIDENEVKVNENKL
jgi:hypothetical protein